MRSARSAPPDRPIPLARSYLYVPGHRLDYIRTALDSGADALVVDLEDGVPGPAKEQARAALGEFGQAVAARRPSPPILVVRTSGSTSELQRELELSVAAGARLVRLPKVDRAATVEAASEMLDGLVARDTRAAQVGLQPMIESAAGVLSATGIACAPRVVSLVLGAADLAADLGLPRGSEDGLDVVRATLVLASAACHVAPPVDAVHLAIREAQEHRVSTEHSRRLGFFGRSAVHPRQVDVINDVFTPSRRDVEAAERVVAETTGHDGGAMSIDGMLVDAPVLQGARRLLKLRDRFGERAEVA